VLEIELDRVQKATGELAYQAVLGCLKSQFADAQVINDLLTLRGDDLPARLPGVLPRVSAADDEPVLAESLLQVLSFFNRNREFITQVPPITPVRETTVRYFADLDLEQIENAPYLFEILQCAEAEEYNERLAMLKTIVHIFKVLKDKQIAGKTIIDNRSAIRDKLSHAENEEIYFGADSASPGEVRLGVFAIADSIYNFSAFVSARAVQDAQTEPVKIDTQWDNVSHFL